MLKILITSVGSLVGQNVLDSLESRRDHVCIIGTNSVAENQRNFRCDKVYLVPPTDQSELFNNTFHEIFEHERPDFVFAGRDIDVVFLARYKEEHPYAGTRIHCGSSALAGIMFDKYQSYCFALKHKLPFADTFLYRNKEDYKGLNKFIQLHGFPLIVKPRFGFGSNNVFFLTDYEQVNSEIEDDNELIVQEYLCPDENFQHYIRQYRRGIPIFFQVPEMNHFVTQSILSTNHQLLGSISTRHILEGGKAVYSEIYKNSDVDELVRKYVGVLSSLGWIGFINIQYKPDKNGNWKVFEINPRIAGATSTRLLLGFDELGILINSVNANYNFPLLSSNSRQEHVVLKYLTDHVLMKEDIITLIEHKIWQKP